MARQKILNGQVVDMTTEDEAAMQLSMPQAKRITRGRIAARRLEAERGGFTYAGKRYDSNDRGTIALLANGARAGAAGFPVRVVALDDTETALTAAEYQAFEAAAISHLLACSANARTLRQAVNAAADVDAVLAIDLDAGWP